jgi:hypothetical protein
MNFIKGISKFAVLAVLIAVLGTTFVADVKAADEPLLPTLSLTGGDDSWNENFYEDGRIWLPTKAGDKQREFLLPVFIANIWKDNEDFDVNDITSFKFSVCYDGSTLQAIGIETEVPANLTSMEDRRREVFEDLDDKYDVPLRTWGYNFNYITKDIQDDIYWKQIDESSWEVNKNQREAGHRFIIDASSAIALDTTSKKVPSEVVKDISRGGNYSTDDFKVLFFIRFAVEADLTNGQSAEFISKKPIYIDERKIYYNDVNVGTEEPDLIKKEMVTYPTSFDGLGRIHIKPLAGISNEGSGQFNIEPYVLGSVSVNFFDTDVEFKLEAPSNDNAIIPNTDENGDVIPGEYQLVNPITVDENSKDIAQVKIKVSALASTTLLSDVSIISDAEWLRFRDDSETKNHGPRVSTSKLNTVSEWYLHHVEDRIDNGILGTLKFPDADETDTYDDGDYFLKLGADTRYINDQLINDDERTGWYEGWITFKAPHAAVNPVRLKVRFLYIKNPDERNNVDQNPTGGITLKLSNSDSSQEPIDLVFGTGSRATVFADALYGETVANEEWNLVTDKFAARWFPDVADEDAINLIKDSQQEELLTNGYGDFAPNFDKPRTSSRDIRYADSDVNTYSYLCKFKYASEDYPVVLSWNPADFPEGALIYLKDAENGKYFEPLNMRNNSTGQTTYTFTDTDIKEFYIEYSLPKTFEFVDEKGAPVIQSGWNMLSMPLDPYNKNYNKVYPNSISIPYQFTLNQYDPVVTHDLTFGQGYFVKYSGVVDTKFVGAKVDSLPVNGEKIRVYPSDLNSGQIDPDLQDEMGGWNLVGTISYVTGLSGLEFEPLEGATDRPLKEFTIKKGFWQYQPKKGYVSVNVLRPGYAYWMKTDKGGYYTLKQDVITVPKATNEEVIKAENSEIIIRDNAKNENKLYISTDMNIDAAACELPPCPPVEVFDVRYDNNTYLTNDNVSIIKLQGVTYPANIYVENSPAEYIFTDAKTGKLFGSISKGFSGNIAIDEAVANTVKMTKVATETGIESKFEVYPNPAKAVSTVNFNVTVDSYVTVKVYNELGNEVMTVKEGQLNAGNYSEMLDVTNLTSGNYIVRIAYGNTSEVVKVTVVK